MTGAVRRIRFLPETSRYVIESRSTRKVLGFWPVYVWDKVMYANSKQAASEWLERLDK